MTPPVAFGSVYDLGHFGLGQMLAALGRRFGVTVRFLAGATNGEIGKLN
jgi:hypothetical protein